MSRYEKAKDTMLQRYGAPYTLQSVELRKKVKNTTIKRYGVENIQQNSEFKRLMYQKIRQSQLAELPIRMQHREFVEPFIKLEDTDLKLYKLREEASQKFLSKYGFNQYSKFGKFHLSFGLVSDDILYQVIRFELHKNKIHLSDFGTREGYHINNYYQKLMKFALQVSGIDSFISTIPKHISENEDIINSLDVTFVKEEPYDVYWIIEDKIKKLTLWDKPKELLKKYDYVTTDYKMIYEHS